MKIPNVPDVTVLMPVFNGETYLREAIESILAQTFPNFEFLIINDGSNDHSSAIIESYRDTRIVLAANESNLGLVAALNRGLDLARGEYIARMDGDDLSLPERLAKQVAFMEDHPEIGLCGTWFFDMQTGLDIIRPTEHDALVEFMVTWGCPFAHPAVMMRNSVLRRNGLYYDPDYQHAEDFELWFRIAKITRLANLPEVLVWRRSHPAQISRRYAREQELITRSIIDLHRGSFIKKNEANGDR